MATNASKDGETTETLNDGSGNATNDSSYLAHLIEEMMREMGVDKFDDRTSHMLVDILQRESLEILKNSVDFSEKRFSMEKEKLLCGSNSNTNILKPNMKVTEEDAQLACQEYMSKQVIQPGLLEDIINMHKYANSARFGAKATYGTSTKSNRGLSSLRNDNALGYFPSGTLPHLPENISINTLLPNWDISLKQDKA